MDQLRDLGVDTVVERHADFVESLGENSVSVVVDNVAGPTFPSMLKVLKPGGGGMSRPVPLQAQS